MPPPFQGDFDAVRNAHLNEIAGPVTADLPRLNSLVHAMLRKAPESRPSLKRCEDVLKAVHIPSSGSGKKSILSAAEYVSQKEALEEAASLAKIENAERRKALSVEAAREIIGITKRLFDDIASSGESVKVHGLSVSMGSARLTFEKPTIDEGGALIAPESHSWDIVAYSRLELNCEHDVGPSSRSSYVFESRLVYCKTKTDSDFRWREISFFSWAARNQDLLHRPAALCPGTREFNLALSNVVSGWQIAFGPWVIDAEDEETFHDRWLKLFAKAASGKLHPSNQFPIPQIYFD